MSRIRSRELGYHAGVNSLARVRWILLASIVPASSLVPARAFAQGEPSAEPATDVKAEPAATPVEAPKSEAAIPPPQQPIPSEARQFTFEPYGYLRLQYKIVQNDPFVAFVGRDDGFELQNARIGVAGYLGDTRRVRYMLAIDGAVDERAQVNVPDGKLRVGLRDASVDVFVSGHIAVRGGYFKTVVDPDLDPDNGREFVDRPLESRGVRPTQGYQTPGLGPGRSLGAAIRLEPGEGESPSKIGFEIAVQNGADEFASDNDNDTPAISASVIARPQDGMWFVASGRWNRRTDGELPLQRDEDDFQGSAGGRAKAGPLVIGAGGIVQRTQFPTTGGPVRNAYGAHAMVLAQFDGKMPVAFGYRFGILDPSSLILTDRVMEHSAGGTVSVPSLHMRFQLQLTHAVEQGERDLKNDRIQLAAELTL